MFCGTAFLISYILIKIVAGDFAERLLEQHNELRATHNIGPLKLDDDLTKKANDFVRKAAKDGEFFDGQDPPPGVNTMMVCASYKRKEDSAKDVASSWYDEVCSDDFSFSDPNTLQKATAFTQMIWKDTKLLGVAKASSKDGAESCSFIAAVYRPAGNIDSGFKDNVKEGEFKKSEYCSKFNDNR